MFKAGETASNYISSIANLKTFSYIPSLNDLSAYARFYNIDTYLFYVQSYSFLFQITTEQVSTNLFNKGYILGPSIDLYQPHSIHRTLPDFCPARTRPPVHQPTNLPFNPTKKPNPAPVKRSLPPAAKPHRDNNADTNKKWKCNLKSIF